MSNSPKLAGHVVFPENIHPVDALKIMLPHMSPEIEKQLRDICDELVDSQTGEPVCPGYQWTKAHVREVEHFDSAGNRYTQEFHEGGIEIIKDAKGNTIPSFGPHGLRPWEK